MNRSVSFVLWLIPIVFLVVDLGDQGLLEGVTFWFFLVVILLFVARSIGMIGEHGDVKGEPPENDKPRWWLQIALFLLTILTTTWAGAAQVGMISDRFVVSEDLLRPWRHDAIGSCVGNRLAEVLVLIAEQEMYGLLLRHIASEQFHRRLQVCVRQAFDGLLQTGV